MKVKKGGRGLRYVEFKDVSGIECTLQMSSLATEAAIWFGVDNANPQILRSNARRMGIPDPTNDSEGNGYQPYLLPQEVSMTTRMLLSQKRVKKLLPLLKHFAKHGELP